MVARKNPSPVTPQPKQSGLVSLRFRIRLRRPLPHDHAEGGRRRAVGGGGQEAATLPRRGSPPRRGGGDCDRRREGGRRGGDMELSSRSTPARRGGGNGRRLEGGGGAGRGGDGELWPGSPPPRLGRGHGGWRREGAGRSGDWELSSGLPPLRQGGVDCRRRDSGGGHRVGGHRGGYGELSAGSASAGGGAAGRGDEVVVVHTCHVCSKTFDRVKALHGHMRSCRAAAEKLSPVALRQERAKKQRVEKKADDEGLLARALERSWAGIGRHRRRRIPIHGGGDSRAPRAKWSRVSAQDRAPISVILSEVTRLQVGEEDLDQPWAAEMVRAAHDLMSLSAGEAGFGPVAVPKTKIPEVKVPEPLSTNTIRNYPVVPDTDVIVIDDEEEEDVEPNNAVAEINASAVTIAISVPDAPATVTIEPAPDAAAAVTITAAPATPSAVAVATASDTVASAVTIAAAPDATKGKEVTVSTGNGGVAAIAGAGEIKVYRGPQCFKTFNSYQALGGHMAYHNICQEGAKEMKKDVKDVAAPMNREELHVCAKCSKTFPTGQALGEHMRLHYADELLGAGKTSVWAAPSTASGLSLPNPAAAGRSPFVFTLLKQEGEPPEEMAMTWNGVPVYVPAATAFGSSLPADTSSSFPLAFTMPKLEEEKPPGVMAMAPRNGARPRGGFRLFGVDFAEGPKEEPKE